MGTRSRRRLSTTLALVLMAVLLAACGGGGPQQAASEGAATSEAAGPQVGGTFVWGELADATNFNPILVADTASGDVSGMIFNGLLKVDDKLQIVPDLATYDVSDDGLTYTFHLKDGVTWHDGQPLTADDVAFTFQAILSPKYQGVRASDYDHLVGASELLQKYSDIDAQVNDKKIDQATADQQKEAAFQEFLQGDGIKVLDDHTIQFKLSGAFAPFLANMTMGIIPKHVFNGDYAAAGDMKNGFGLAADGLKPIGTGPYEFVEWAHGDHITVKRNPNYFDSGPDGKRPYIDQIVYRIIPDQNTIEAALESGDIDMGGIQPQSFDHMKQVESINVLEYPTLSYTWMAFQLKNPLFSDVRVRQAICYAIDKESMVKNIELGHGQVAWTHGSPASWEYNPDVPKCEYDPAKAKDLLAQAGWSDTDGDGILDKGGQKFSFVIETNTGNKVREQAATLIQANLKAVGIDAQPKLVDFSTLVQELLAKAEKDAVILGWQLGVDPDSWSIWGTDQDFNFVNYSNPQVDEWLKEARTATDQATRKDLYGKVEVQLAEDQPYVFLFYPNALVGINKRVQGPIEGTPAGVTWNFTEWYIGQ